MNRPLRHLLLSLFSAVLLSVSWFAGMGIVIFFAFIPLLIVEKEIREGESARAKLRLFGYSYLTFLVWNVLVTWWVVYASLGGACLAFIFNSLLMATVFLIFSNIKFRTGSRLGIWFLIPCWLAWEHGHTLWDISWTWLTLGNVFAFHTQWVQWYEFTGTSGGSFWILAANILGFQAATAANKKIITRPIIKLSALIVLPILISYVIYFVRSKPAAGIKTEVVVVQPNIDPYNEKFTVDFRSQFLKMLKMVKNHVGRETDFLVLPETFVSGDTDDLNEEMLSQYPEIQWFRETLISTYPKLKIVTGATTYQFYFNEHEVSATARKHSGSGFYYDFYNSAIYLDKYTSEVYHKSKLVPGVERMPFPALLKPLEKLAINMGGTMGSLGTQRDREVFVNSEKNIGVAPVVCYESIYADYVADYVRKGASLIFIITNDGWWDDTPGYIQHLNYARLRAIENRRQIARSANTGISCFIDELGNIHQQTPWWKEAVIKQTLTARTDLTFFSRFGDLLSYASVITSLGLWMWSVVILFRKKAQLAEESGS